MRKIIAAFSVAYVAALAGQTQAEIRLKPDDLDQHARDWSAIQTEIYYGRARLCLAMGMLAQHLPEMKASELKDAGVENLADTIDIVDWTLDVLDDHCSVNAD